MPSKIIPDEHREKMVSDYLAGATAKEAAAQFGYSYMACVFALEQRGIGRRTRSEAHRRYAVNEAFFSCIDTEEKAYWLGFLSADGTVREQCIKISLAIKDKKHVHKFAKALNAEHPVVVRDAVCSDNAYRVAELQIGSMKIVEDLKRLGVIPNKSLTVAPCKQVPSGLLRHYWRGVFDGDGSISFSRNRKVGELKCHVSLTCSKAMVLGFQEFVWMHIFTRAKPVPTGNIYRISYSGVALPQAILRLHYDGATIYLERKKVLVDKVLSMPVRRVVCSGITKEELETLYREQETWKSVADYLGTTIGRLWYIRKRVGLL